MPENDWAGHVVKLPDGSRIPNPFRDDPRNYTGFVTGPADDLQDIAAAARRDGEKFRELKKSQWTYAQAALFLIATFMANVGTGGRFDHQRRGNLITGFEQLRHFRPISNINVGLYGQQFGLSLEQTLELAGAYASVFSGSYDPSKPDKLKDQTSYFIREGFRIGETGMFNPKVTDR